MADFIMPSLGADMESATVMKWLVKPGDAVKRGDVIAEVETDKGVIEIECFETGVVEKLVAEPGARSPSADVMAVIRIGPRRHRMSQPLARKIATDSASTSPNSLAPAAGGLVPRGRRARCRPATACAPGLPAGPQGRGGTGRGPIQRSRHRPGGVIERADVEQAAAARRPLPVPRKGVPTACAARSPPPWRSRTARSRTTTCRPAST